MELRAKITAKYLDDVLAGRKLREYRNIEGITLVDENGRAVKCDILNIRLVTGEWIAHVKNKYPDIRFREDPAGHPSTYIYSLDIRNPKIVKEEAKPAKPKKATA